MTPQKKNAPITKSNESAAKPIIQKQVNTASYPKTTNQTELRALNALIEARVRGVSRKELDKACGSSNSPEVVRRLRARGFAIHCEMRQTHNRFGESVRAGYYTLSGFTKENDTQGAQ